MRKYQFLWRGIIYAAVVIALFCMGNTLFQPAWMPWNNFYTTNGFYREENDTIETLFLGTSTMVNGVEPMLLFEEYGVCTYNLATEQQPVEASYFLLTDAYARHDDSLKTVVLDVASFVKDSTESYYRKALSAMPFSLRKLQAFYEMTDGNLESAIHYAVPLFGFHSRWESLTEADFEKFGYDPVSGSRGYNADFSSRANLYTLNEANPLIATMNERVEPAVLDEEALSYFERIRDFCNQHDLQLILVKMPARNWAVNENRAVQILAEDNNLVYLSLASSPLYDELGLIDPLDMIDNTHMNYYGAEKITQWLGEYLSKNAMWTDIRDQKRFEFMDVQYEKYKQTISHMVLLKESRTIDTYIAEACRNGNHVLISVCSDGANRLTEKQRQSLSEIGLEELASLGYRDSLIAVIENGKVVFEKRDPDVPGTKKKPIQHTGEFGDGTKYSVKSGGFNNGFVASCMIDKKEYALNKRGINVVVYDAQNGKIEDSACFDTFLESSRQVYQADTYRALKNGELSGAMAETLDAYLKRAEEANADVQ